MNTFFNKSALKHRAGGVALFIFISTLGCSRTFGCNPLTVEDVKKVAIILRELNTPTVAAAAARLADLENSQFRYFRHYMRSSGKVRIRDAQVDEHLNGYITEAILEVRSFNKLLKALGYGEFEHLSSIRAMRNINRNIRVFLEDVDLKYRNCANQGEQAVSINLD